MQTLNWLETHIGSLEEGIKLVNRFHWVLTVVEARGSLSWAVMAGEKIIFTTDTRDAVDAFLYGMSLAYSVIPDPLFDQLVETTANWF